MGVGLNLFRTSQDRITECKLDAVVHAGAYDRSLLLVPNGLRTTFLGVKPVAQVSPPPSPGRRVDVLRAPCVVAMWVHLKPTIVGRDSAYGLDKVYVCMRCGNMLLWRPLRAARACAVV